MITISSEEDIVGTDLPSENSDPWLHKNLVAKLRTLLLNGELAAGSRIPEAELCKRFGVSRTPLREALKVMAAEGLVILRPNRGSIVAPVDPDQIGPLFEFKGALERLIGLTAAVRATDEEIAALESIHLELDSAAVRGHHESYTRLNYTFHNRLAQTTRNSVLIQSYEAVQQKIWRYRFLVNEHAERVQNSFAEHERIIIALRARTPLDLAERLEVHNRLTGLAMMEMMSQLMQADKAKSYGKNKKGKIPSTRFECHR